jgi:3-(3-hydroxy-phenyl)propionate hydroxylase
VQYDRRDMRKPTDVAVVGAGPVGLSLALGLARAGRSVVVLEKEAGTSEHSRAPAIWPRTQEVLAGLEVLDRLVEEGLPLERGELWDGDRGRVLLRLPFTELAAETPYPRLLIVPQSVTERVLAAALAEQPTAELRFSAAVEGIEPNGRTVKVTVRGDRGLETVEAAFVAGCDGAHSTVRHALGASFDGLTYEVRAALADVALERDDPGLPFPRFSTHGSLALAIRISEQLWRLILPVAEDDPLPLDARVERAVAQLFGATGYRTVWRSDFRLHRRIASTFARGRVVLAGDAAHLNSPVGGQGMNAGIQDAEGLTAALLAALDADDPVPITTWADRRREAVRGGVNRFTDRMTRLLLLGRGRFIKPALRLVALATRLPPIRHRLLRRLAMLD